MLDVHLSNQLRMIKMQAVSYGLNLSFLRGFVSCMYRQRYAESCAGVHLAFDLNIAAVIFDETVAHRQSQPDALDLVFGGKKTIKNFADIFFSNAHAGVG